MAPLPQSATVVKTLHDGDIMHGEISDEEFDVGKGSYCDTFPALFFSDKRVSVDAGGWLCPVSEIIALTAA